MKKPSGPWNKKLDPISTQTHKKVRASNRYYALGSLSIRFFSSSVLYLLV